MNLVLGCTRTHSGFHKCHGFPFLQEFCHGEVAYGALQRPADAIVIGGGLAGMSASIALLDRGGSVVMVEKQLGSRVSSPQRSCGTMICEWLVVSTKLIIVGMIALSSTMDF